MAQHDYVIDNSTGANVRADINSVLQAIASNNSGSSQPSTTYAFQFFANTSNEFLQLRNAANNDFVNLRKFDGRIEIPSGSLSEPSLFINNDLNTGIFSSAADNLDIVTGGSVRLNLSSAGLTILDKIIHAGDTNTAIRFPANDTVSIETGGSERARFDSNGRLGVATSSPNTFAIATFNDSNGISLTGSSQTRLVLTHQNGGSDQKNFDIQFDSGNLKFRKIGDNNTTVTERMRIDSSGNCLAAKAFVGKKTNDANVGTSTSSGFTANTFNVVLDQDVLENGSGYLITFFWAHQGSGQPFESYGSFTFFPGNTNPGSSGAMGPNFVPLQGAHTEQGVSKFWTFRYYSSTGQHVHGLQAAFSASLNDANGQGQITVMAMKLADTTTI